MASLILAAGSPGMRNSLPNARVMIHQPSGGAQVHMLNNCIECLEISYEELQELVISFCEMNKHRDQCLTKDLISARCSRK